MDEHTLILGDCLDKMGQIEDGSIDAIICDLPYGTTACKWDTIVPFEPLWAHYKRVIKKRGAVVLFGSQPFTSMLVITNLTQFKHHWIWDKKKPVGFQVAKYRPMMQHEDIIVFGNSEMTYNPQKTPRPYIKKSKLYGNSAVSPLALNKNLDRVYTEFYPKSIIEVSNADQNNRLHPTQKPVALLEYLIKTYTNPGELVLDNTFGSCSTGEACLRTGRRFIGIEKDPGYFEIGRARMERVAAELRGEFVSKPTNGKVEDLPMFAGIA